MTTAKQIQKELACYTQDKRVKSFHAEVYCDRLVILAGWYMVDFFRRRGVVADSDRGGVAISIKDAEKLGLPTETGCYTVPRDARKSWVKTSNF